VAVTSRVLLTFPFQSERSLEEKFSRMHFFNEEGARDYIPGPFFVFTVWAVVALCGIAFAAIYLLGSW
jgi:hypothetical protein